MPVIDLGAGEPDFDTPGLHPAGGGRRPSRRGATRYTATRGHPGAPRGHRGRRQPPAAGRAPSRFTAAEVVVSSGSKQSLFNACMACFGPGDEVLVPTPSWTSYYEMLELARATAVPVYRRRRNAASR